MIALLGAIIAESSKIYLLILTFFLIINRVAKVPDWDLNKALSAFFTNRTQTKKTDFR